MSLPTPTTSRARCSPSRTRIWCLKHMPAHCSLSLMHAPSGHHSRRVPCGRLKFASTIMHMPRRYMPVASEETVCTLHAHAAPPRFIPQALLQQSERYSIVGFDAWSHPGAASRSCRLSFTTRTSYRSAVGGVPPRQERCALESISGGAVREGLRAFDVGLKVLEVLRDGSTGK